MHSNPEFIVYTGSMFSGKTSRLLSLLDRYKYQNKSILAFKPKIDDRYSVSEISSHSGWKFPAVCISNGADVLEYLSQLDTPPPQVIAVDEAFMMPGIAESLVWLYKNGFTVVVSSLEMSATGKPFPEIERMLVWATHIEKCTAVCTVCGKDAPYTHKKQTGGDEIEVGGEELYSPRCYAHHLFINSREKLYRE